MKQWIGLLIVVLFLMVTGSVSNAKGKHVVGQKLAVLSAQFFETLTAKQKTQANQGQEVQLFGKQLTPEQRKIALE